MSELKALRYTVHHTGIPVNNPEDYDPAKYYNRSGVVYVDTLCDCKMGKGIHYYFDWYNEDGDDSVYCEKRKRSPVHPWSLSPPVFSVKG